MSSLRVSENQLLDLFHHGIQNVQPSNILKNFLKVSGKNIKISHKNSYKIYKNFNKIFLICIGKASIDMATTAYSILNNFADNISDVIVVVNKENFKNVPGFTCFSSGHPIPNKKGLEASKYIEQRLKMTMKNDLVLVLLSGGGSALLPYPVSNIKLDEKIKINKLLLASGANIIEINTVRKHLSKIKGGNLLKMSHPSKVHTLILSDVVGDDLSSISSGLTVPDETTFGDVKKILTKYRIWTKAPISIRSHIEKGLKDLKLETPNKKNKIFNNSCNTIIGSNLMCLKSIHQYCKLKKIPSKLWKVNIEEDVEILAKKFVQDLKKYINSKPIVLISGGETTVKLKGKGKGGRNQEFAIHFIRNINKLIPSIEYSLLSAGTDGRDGPTDAAGALVNNKSINLILEKNIDLDKEINNNNSYKVLKKINSLVIMSGTNTNVADLQLLLIK